MTDYTGFTGDIATLEARAAALPALIATAQAAKDALVIAAGTEVINGDATHAKLLVDIEEIEKAIAILMERAENAQAIADEYKRLMEAELAS